MGVAGVVWLIVTALRRRDASGAAPAARGRAWAGGVSGHGALERLGMRDDAGASSRSRTYRPSTRIAEPSRPGAKAGLATSESGMNRLVHRQRWCDLRALPEHPDHHRSACAITPDSPTVTMRRWRRASRCSPPPASWGSFPTEATRRSTASPSRWQAELGNEVRGRPGRPTSTRIPVLAQKHGERIPSQAECAEQAGALFKTNGPGSDWRSGWSRRRSPRRSPPPRAGRRAAGRRNNCRVC